MQKRQANLLDRANQPADAHAIGRALRADSPDLFAMLRKATFCLTLAAVFSLPTPGWAQLVDTDPAIQALAESRPATPEQAIRTARSLVALGRPDLAKPFIQQVAAQNLAGPALVELADQLGLATFNELADQVELQPEAAQLASQITAARTQQAQDPVYINEQIDGLNSADPQVRAYHIRRLRRSGSDAVGPLVERLAATDDPQVRRYLREALVGLGPFAKPGLEAIASASTNPQLVASAAHVLGRLGERSSVEFLLAPALLEETDPLAKTQAQRAIQDILGGEPTREAAVAYLVRKTEAAAAGRREFPLSVDGAVKLWTWDDATGKLVGEPILVEDAALEIAARLAQAAYALDADDPDVRQLYLQTTLEASVYRDGLHRLPSEMQSPIDLSGFSTAELLRLVERVMTTINSPAAIPAVNEIARREEIGLLDSVGGVLPILVKAAVSPDPRLRLAAAQAVIKLDPGRTYAGASLIVESLGYLSSSTGSRRAVVASLSANDGRQIAALTESLGYESYATLSGREMFCEAAKSIDTEVVFITVDLGCPQAEFALDTLRLDPRTKTLPAGIVGSPQLLEILPVRIDPASIDLPPIHPFDQEFGGMAPRISMPRPLPTVRVLPLAPELTIADRIARHDELAEKIVRPAELTDRTEAEVLAYQLEPLLLRRPRNVVTTPEERLAISAVALGLLQEIAEEPTFRYDLGRVLYTVQQALYVSELREEAIAVLARIRRCEAQGALIELTQLAVLSDEARAAALEGFLESLERFGPLMPPSRVAQILATAQADENPSEIQRTAGLIIAALEQRAIADGTIVLPPEE